jgi:MraZ protein
MDDTGKNDMPELEGQGAGEHSDSPMVRASGKSQNDKSGGGTTAYARYMRLYGPKPYRVDQKGKISLPKEVREELGDKMMLTTGITGPFIWLLPLDVWDRILTALEKDDESDPELLGYLIGNASPAELDTVNRLQLPQTLRRFAELGDEVLVVGVGETIQIWDRARKEAIDKELMQTGVIKDKFRKFKY